MYSKVEINNALASRSSVPSGGELSSSESSNPRCGEGVRGVAADALEVDGSFSSRYGR